MMHARLSSGLSYQFDKLRIGAVVAGAFSRMEMRQLLHDPSDNFELPGTGLRYKSDPAYAFTGGFGLAYSWSGPTIFHLDGEMRTNIGNPDYYHRNQVSMHMTWPEQHRIGLRTVFGKLALLLDLGYINWSSYLNTIKFNLDQPVVATPFGFDSSSMVMNLHLRDQTIYSAGIEYTLSDIYILRCGYNYARTNSQTEGINPLFSVLTEHHFATGIGIKSENLNWDIALEYSPKNKQAGGNTSNWDIAHAIFGINNIQTHKFTHSKSMSAGAFFLSITYKFDNS